MAVFHEIAREIERRVRTGAYPPGTSLPTRFELLREFNVARATLDRAVASLTDSGILVSRQGAGTFVCEQPRSEFSVAIVGNATAREFAGCRFAVTPIAAETMTRRSDWNRLLKFDGVLWMRPDAELAGAIDFIRTRRPQVAVNREISGIDCVLSDDRGAYRQITSERLKVAGPDGSVVFLRSQEPPEPFRRRGEGFIDACRDAGRFYEIWQLPTAFDARLAELRCRVAELRRPALFVADCRAQTGSFMRLAAELDWKLGSDVFYSDFDNHFDDDFWGVVVTSFLQDFRLLLSVAADRLLELLEHRGENTPVTRLIPPTLRRGDT